MAGTTTFINTGTTRPSYLVAQGFRHGIYFDGVTLHKASYAHFYEDTGETTICDGGSAVAVSYEDLAPTENVFRCTSTMTASATTEATHVVLFDDQNQAMIQHVLDSAKPLSAGEQFLTRFRGTVGA